MSPGFETLSVEKKGRIRKAFENYIFISVDYRAVMAQELKWKDFG